MSTTGILYLVATPIGNLEDVTLRALRILKEVDIIAAEDTRVTRKLLSHFDIHTHMTAYNQHSKGQRVKELLDALVEGKNIAVVSDAGTPGISDPGHELVLLAVNNNIRIEPIPGACAAIAGLIVSGLSTTQFIFEGFPPRKNSERKAFFSGLSSEGRTICLYEAPQRLLDTLKAINQQMGNRRIAIAREITKLFEEIFRGTVEEALARFEAEKPRGEIVIIIEGAAPVIGLAAEDITELIKSRLNVLRSEGLSDRDAVRQCSVEMRIPRKQVYSIALQSDKDKQDRKIL